MAKVKVNTPLEIWYDENTKEIKDFEKQMRCKVHYVIKPKFLLSNITELARTQDPDLLVTLDKRFKYIQDESFESAFQGLFSEINLNSEKLERPLPKVIGSEWDLSFSQQKGMIKVNVAI